MPTHFSTMPPASSGLPSRPDAHVFNGVIPLFFIGRNKNGFWIAREARRRSGGIFLLRRSALRFAQIASAPHAARPCFWLRLSSSTPAMPAIRWSAGSMRHLAW